MNKRSLAALVFVNAVLLVALLFTSFSSDKAVAQSSRHATTGNYVMTAGYNKTKDKQQLIYIMDLNSGRLLSVKFDGVRDRFEVEGSRDTAQDAKMIYRNR